MTDELIYKFLINQLHTLLRLLIGKRVVKLGCVWIGLQLPQLKNRRVWLFVVEATTPAARFLVHGRTIPWRVGTSVVLWAFHERGGASRGLLVLLIHSRDFGQESPRRLGGSFILLLSI